MKTNAFVLFLLLAPLSPLHAQQFEDLDALDTKIAAATGANIGEPNGALAPVDRRLKLARCPSPVTMDQPAMGAVAVRCAELGWRIRVPLTRIAKSTQVAAQQQEILVRRGERVEIVTEGYGFEVSTGAIAMDDGVLGKAIRVKTLTGNNSTIATVKSRGTVYIPH